MHHLLLYSDLSFHSMDTSDHSSCKEQKPVKTGSGYPVKTRLTQPDTTRQEKGTVVHRQELYQETFKKDTINESFKQEMVREKTRPEVNRNPEPSKLPPLEDPSIILTSSSQTLSSKNQQQITGQKCMYKCMYI